MNERPSRQPVAFESEGAVLRGFLYRAARGDAPYPMVIMAHGTSATISMVADRYAEVFAAAGISALLYDHRNFGLSGGVPRQEINPWVQCRGFRDATTYAATIDDHDPARIGLWGRTSQPSTKSSSRSSTGPVRVQPAEVGRIGSTPVKQRE